MASSGFPQSPQEDVLVSNVVGDGLLEALTLALRFRARLYDAGLYDEETKADWDCGRPRLHAATRAMDTTGVGER